LENVTGVQFFLTTVYMHGSQWNWKSYRTIIVWNIFG